MIYVLFNDGLQLTDLERQENAKMIREKLKPVQDEFPEADMTAIYTSEGRIKLISSNHQLLPFAEKFLEY
jgi:hypothetical protein